MELDRRDIKTLLIFLLTVAVGWRLYIAFNYAPLSGDSKVYTEIAQNLLSGNGYSLNDQPPYRPTSYRTPGYPFFIVLLYLFNRSDIFIRICQAILDTLTCLLIYLIAFNVTSSRYISILALFLAALCPYTAIYTSYILPESLATFLVTLSTYLYILAMKHKKLFLHLLCGVAVGLATMTRPNFILLFVLFLAASFIFSIKRGKVFSMFKAPFFLFLGFLLIVSPWIFRNYVVSKKIAPPFVYGQLKATGYDRWLSTWLDGQYLYQDYLWGQPETAGEYPAFAFDSEEEKKEVDNLLRKFFEDRPAAYNFGLAISSLSTLADPELENYFTTSQTQEVLNGFRQIADEKIKRGPFKYYIYLRLRRFLIMWFSTVFCLYPFKANILDRLLKSEFDLFLKNLILFGLNFFYILFAIVGFYIGITRLRSSLVFLTLPILSVAALGVMAYPSFFEARYILEMYPSMLVLSAVGINRLLRFDS